MHWAYGYGYSPNGIFSVNDGCALTPTHLPPPPPLLHVSHNKKLGQRQLNFKPKRILQPVDTAADAGGAALLLYCYILAIPAEQDSTCCCCC